MTGDVVLTAAQERKVRVLRMLMDDESVPAALAKADLALRAAAHRYDKATVGGKCEALSALRLAAVVFDEEVSKCKV